MTIPWENFGKRISSGEDPDDKSIYLLNPEAIFTKLSDRSSADNK